MRFIAFVMGGEAYEAHQMPSEQELKEMNQFNEELVKAGVMLAGEGLHPSSKAVRVNYDGDTPTVTDGPFTEAKELVAGYWVWEVKSKEEAVEWARRCPAEEGNVIEVRQIWELEEFPEDVQAAAAAADIRLATPTPTT